MLDDGIPIAQIDDDWRSLRKTLAENFTYRLDRQFQNIRSRFFPDASYESTSSK